MSCHTRVVRKEVFPSVLAVSAQQIDHDEEMAAPLRQRFAQFAHPDHQCPHRRYQELLLTINCQLLAVEGALTEDSSANQDAIGLRLLNTRHVANRQAHRLVLHRRDR